MLQVCNELSEAEMREANGSQFYSEYASAVHWLTLGLELETTQCVTD